MISVKNLKMNFKSERTGQPVQVLKGLTFDVAEGDCLAILGESGSGKSTLGRILVGLLKPTAGSYRFLDRTPYQSKADKRFLSQQVSMVFQDYNTSVNPRFTVFDIIAESVDVMCRRNKIKLDRQQTVLDYLTAVGLTEDYLHRFPHQLSGGQLQRVCIARAIATKPKVILLDEAISSLDAHTQVEVMDLLKKLQAQYNLTYLFITHDLTSVTYLCNKVLFLYEGQITELIDVKDIANTKDDYAQKLLRAVVTI